MNYKVREIWGLFWFVGVYFGLWLVILVCGWLFWFVLVCCGLFWFVVVVFAGQFRLWQNPQSIATGGLIPVNLQHPGAVQQGVAPIDRD